MSTDTKRHWVHKDKTSTFLIWLFTPTAADLPGNGSDTNVTAIGVEMIEDRITENIRMVGYYLVTL